MPIHRQPLPASLLPKLSTDKADLDNLDRKSAESYEIMALQWMVRSRMLAPALTSQYRSSYLGKNHLREAKAISPGFAELIVAWGKVCHFLRKLH